MRPLHWTIIATQVPPGGSLGGVVRYTTELIRALAVREDVVVSALTTAAAADTVAELVGDRARVSTIPNAPVPLLSIAERNAPLPSLRSADVVHGIKHLVPARTKALRVLTVHDMLLLDRPDDFGRAKRLLLPASYRGSIRDADLLLCVSAATRTRLEAQVPGSTPRAAVVHLATSPTLRASSARPVPSLAGREFALVVGDSSPRKNLGTVLAAWAAVRDSRPDAVLAIAGPPNWGRDALGTTYDALVASGAVLPLGHVGDDELRWSYENAAVVLCPSLAEGYGLPAAEALSFGAPILISSDPAQVEVAAGRALKIVAPLDVAGWSQAIVAAFARPARTGVTGPVRTWSEVADETVTAVHSALQRTQKVIGE